MRITMRGNRARKLLLMVGLLLAGSIAIDERSHAIDFFSTTNVVVVEETNILNDYKDPSSTTGMIAGIQNVKVACEPLPNECGVSFEGKSFIPVTTWLGVKWIEDDGRVVYGSYREEEKEMTLIADTILYQQPVGITSIDQIDQPKDTGQRLAPQQVKVTATLSYKHKWVKTGRGYVLYSGTWYQLPTSWMGDVWIQDPIILEDVKERPSDVPIKLLGNELLYDYPYAEAGKGELAGGGMVQPTAKAFIGRRADNQIWYKLINDTGVEKWLQVQPEKYEEYTKFRLENEPVQIRTATRLFDSTEESLFTSRDWLQPGSYIADEVKEGWVHIKTPTGWKWVNLDRAPLERPEGITSTEETIRLTPETKTYYFPLTGEVSHEVGTFTNQDAKAYEMWLAKDGMKWYHISTYSGTVWVPEKPLLN